MLLLDLALTPDRYPIPDVLIAVFIQYGITRAFMADRGICVEERRGSPLTVLAAYILSTTGIVLGSIALLIPGIFLMARWFVIVPLIVANGAGPGSALPESWHLVRGNTGAVALALTILYLPLIGLIAAAFAGNDLFYAGDRDPPGLATLAVTEGSVVVTWYAAVAYFEMRGAAQHRLEEVFA